MTEVSYDADDFVVSPLIIQGAHKLHVAVLNEDIDTLRELLRQGVDPDLKLRIYLKETCLHIAMQRVCSFLESPATSGERIWSKSPDMIKILLEHKASVNVLDGRDRQPLYCLFSISSYGDINWCGYSLYEHDVTRMERVLPVLDLLLEHKADINYENDNTETLLSHSCIRQNTPLIEELLERNANSRDGQAMQLACRWSRSNVKYAHYLNLFQKQTKLIESGW